MNNTEPYLTKTEACPLGFSFDPRVRRCQPISYFLIPIYFWMRGPHSPWDAVPTVRGIYPSYYGNRFKAYPSDGHEECWKAVYQTRYSLPLKGMCIHGNDVAPRLVFSLLTPRSFHQGLSLELVHQRIDNQKLTQNNKRLVMTDYRLMNLVDAYHSCMLGLQ